MKVGMKSTGNDLIASLAAAIDRGIAIVGGLDDAEFAFGRNGQSSIGAHIRHNVDFLNALLAGIAVGRVDYNARIRDARVEMDRAYAIEQMSMAILRLNRISQTAMRSTVRVRSEVNESDWHVSSVAREIEFLHSHTVHHYAL